ncbi:MAG: OmpA family protein [Polyangiaceae bacterium]|nr:OmpA family protein [Polyangiaceae bacterium]
MRFALLAWTLLAALPACAARPDAPIYARPYEPPDERIVLFAAGSADVTSAEGYFALGYVVALMDADPSYHALIVGYADGRGAAEYNRELGFRRARSVRKGLMDHGVSPTRLLIAAPRAQEGGAGSSIRRRVDVYVYDPLQDEASKRLGYEVELRAE